MADIEISVDAGTSKRLLTAGKYCDRDILVSASGGAAEPVIQPLEVTANGTYNAPAGVDGYNPVSVNVSGSGGVETGGSIYINTLYNLINVFIIFNDGTGNCLDKLESEYSDGDIINNVLYICYNATDFSPFRNIVQGDCEEILYKESVYGEDHIYKIYGNCTFNRVLQ